MTAAGLAFSADRTIAYAFGENCLGEEGEVLYFAAKETDFEIAVTSESPSDPRTIGTYAAAVLRLILRDFTPGQVPGPQLGNVDFIFILPDRELRRRLSLADAQGALESNLDGADLYRELFP
jgi:hypothetical protein